jgi:hypothetical protein
MRRTLTPAQQATVGLMMLEDISSTNTPGRRYSTAQRILDAISEIDARPFDQKTGQFLEGGVVGGRGKLQLLEMVQEMILPGGQLAEEFQYPYDV